MLVVAPPEPTALELLADESDLGENELRKYLRREIARMRDDRSTEGSTVAPARREATHAG